MLSGDPTARRLELGTLYQDSFDDLSRKLRDALRREPLNYKQIGKLAGACATQREVLASLYEMKDVEDA